MKNMTYCYWFVYGRKKAVEMELAKCKIDIMSLNNQLLDAIQQKLNLSQQLEAWQVGQRSWASDSYIENSALIFYYLCNHFTALHFIYLGV